MINHIVLVGRLTKKPELRYTLVGIAVSTITLEINRTFRNVEGEYDADLCYQPKTLQAGLSQANRTISSRKAPGHHVKGKRYEFGRI